MSGKNIMTKFAILIQFLQTQSNKSCELSHNIFTTHAQTRINQQMQKVWDFGISPWGSFVPQHFRSDTTMACRELVVCDLPWMPTKQLAFLANAAMHSIAFSEYIEVLAYPMSLPPTLTSFSSDRPPTHTDPLAIKLCTFIQYVGTSLQNPARAR
jgi:hypothetical protein